MRISSRIRLNRTSGSGSSVGSSTIIADTRARITEWWEKRSAASTAGEPAAAPVADLSTRLASLADLHSRGALTDDEYASAKARVLAGE